MFCHRETLRTGLQTPSGGKRQTLRTGKGKHCGRVTNPVRRDPAGNPVRREGKHCGREKANIADGVANPVRRDPAGNPVRREVIGKHCGRGCKPRPAKPRPAKPPSGGKKPRPAGMTHNFIPQEYSEYHTMPIKHYGYR